MRKEIRHDEENDEEALIEKEVKGYSSTVQGYYP